VMPSAWSCRRSRASRWVPSNELRTACPVSLNRPPSLPPGSLNQDSLAEGVAFLCSVDPGLARIHAELGPPPLWAREPGFATLVYVILEQQVSLASARAAYTKLEAAVHTVTPESFLSLEDGELKRIGFSGQKAGYARGLARSLLDRELDLAALHEMDNEAARSALISIRGIGPWTADIYLLMAMLRPDVWPGGDLALVAALQRLKGLSARPAASEMESIALPWKPWRAVAARLLWQYYLSW
jgi:DNA-3-methyladenine glycosylase II